MQKTSVAFIGLGVMGYPMAGFLSKAGFDTKVYNRTTAKTEQWLNSHQGKGCATPKEAAMDSDIVFICVGNDEDVRSVVYGDKGVLSGLKQGAILVDHTTTSAELAIELANACQKEGKNFIDAPVSGGQAGAEKGSLTIMCGGKEEYFNHASFVMQHYAKKITLFGEHGQGQRCKMVNQICIAGVLQGLSEALLLAQKANLDITQVVDTLKHGAAGSWQMENRAVTMAEDKFDFGFAIDWMRKDLKFCLDEAKRFELSLPLTEEVNAQYASLQQQGFGRMDTSVLIKSLKK